MILTVTPNPALDVTWHVDGIHVGETHRADAGVTRAGGKGINVARVANAQGADVRAVSTAGGRTGEEFSAELQASGVPHRLLPVAGATRRSIALVDEVRGDTTVINERGLNPTDAEWAMLVGEIVDALPGASVLVISGSLPPGAPDTLLPILIGLGRDAGVPVIVDTSGPALLQAADAGASVLKPNAAELVEATGIADPIEGARVLIERGAALVLLSRGADGMLAITASAPDAFRLGRSAPSLNDRSSDGDSSSGSLSGNASPGSSSERSSPRSLSGDSSSRSLSERSETKRADPALSILHARLPESLAGNPTGAGDAAVAACAVLLDAGVTDPEQILRRATAWSAAAVLMPLAGEIHADWPDLERAIEIGPLRDEPASAARDRVSDGMSHAANAGSPEPEPPALPAPQESPDSKDPA